MIPHPLSLASLKCEAPCSDPPMQMHKLPTCRSLAEVDACEEGGLVGVSSVGERGGFTGFLPLGVCN